MTPLELATAIVSDPDFPARVALVAVCLYVMGWTFDVLFGGRNKPS